MVVIYKINVHCFICRFIKAKILHSESRDLVVKLKRERHTKSYSKLDTNEKKSQLDE